MGYISGANNPPRAHGAPINRLIRISKYNRRVRKFRINIQRPRAYI